MRVLLIQPPHYYNGKSREPGFFPLGLGYIAKVLLKSGHDVEVLDIWAHQYTNEEVIQKIKGLEYDIVGISALSTQYAYVKWLAAELKKYNSGRIVVGGALATFSPETVLKYTETDICVIGEGEVTFKETVENIDCLEKVKGIYFKQDGEVAKNPLREYIREPDSIEFPAWDIFPVDVYLEHCRVWGHPHIKAMNVIIGRGCPYSCRFCSKVFSEVRLRSGDNIIEEIKELKRRYSIGGIFFNDELAVIDKQRMHEFCDKIEPLNIKWSCQGRVNLVDFDLLKRMKKAGCVAVGYGIESGSQRILDKMNKKITVEQAKRAIEETIRAGMEPVAQMMYGYPGETRETLQETINFFRASPYLGPAGIQTATRFSPATPLPGAELYAQALREGLIKHEENFLEALSAGYDTEASSLLVNFTEFGEEEFWQLKRETEKKIILDHIKRHPFRFLIDYLLLKVSQIKRYYGLFGLKQTIKTILFKLLHSRRQLMGLLKL